MSSCYDDYLTFGGAIREYLTVTSTHGLRRIGWAHRPVARLLWALLFIVAACLFCWCVVKSVEEYQEYPYKTTMHKDAEFTEFAGVTVCNMNPRKTATIHNTVMDPFEQFALNAEWDMTNKTDGDMAPYFQRRQQFSRFLTDRGISDRVRNGHQMHDFILHCSFDGRECNMNTDFVGFWSDMYGNCYTFNGGKRHSKYRTHTAARLGPLTGLSLVMNIENAEYLNALSVETGIKALVHSPTELPFPEEGGFTVPTNTEASVGVEVEELRHLALPYSNCKDGNANKYDYSYSTTACRKLCQQQRLLEKCHCLDPVLPLVPDYPICNMHDKTNKYYQCHKDVQREFKEDASDQCHCSVPCIETRYKTDLSYAAWPSAKFVPYLDKMLYFAYRRNKTYSDKEKNFVALKVYYTDLGKTVFSDVATYTLVMLMVRIGGLSAFFIGASIISFLEFFELLITLLTIPCVDYEPWDETEQKKAAKRHRVQQSHLVQDRIVTASPRGGEGGEFNPVDVDDTDVNETPLPAYARTKIPPLMTYK